MAVPGTRPCAYNGPRWFIGDNETMANPNSDNPDNFDNGSVPLTFSNSGQLAGVSKIFRPIEYLNTTTSWRGYAGAMSMFIGDADYRLYWGAAGKVDSVIDLTHNTVVPFDAGTKSSWGILNAAAVPAAGTFDGRAELSFTDISCVSTFKTQAALQGIIGCSAPAVSLALSASKPELLPLDSEHNAIFQALDGRVIGREVEDRKKVALVRVVVDLRALTLGHDVLDIERVPAETTREHAGEHRVGRVQMNPGETGRAELSGRCRRRRNGDDRVARACAPDARQARHRY